MVEVREERRSPAADATSGHQLPAAAKKRNKNEEKTRMAAELEDKLDNSKLGSTQQQKIC